MIAPSYKSKNNLLGGKGIRHIKSNKNISTKYKVSTMKETAKPNC